MNWSDTTLERLTVKEWWGRGREEEPGKLHNEDGNPITLF